MPAKQYAFMPSFEDPRISAEQHWESMRDELNATRDSLEASNANEVGQAALIDMLRKELDATKMSCAIIERSNTVMRTKLQAAGMLILDALKADELERGAVVSEFAVKSSTQVPVHKVEQITEEDKPVFLKTVPLQNVFTNENYDKENI